MVTAHKHAYKFPRMRDPTVKAFLSTCGLKRYHVPKDGQCMFYAVAVAAGLHRDLTTEPVPDGVNTLETVKRTQELWSAAQVFRSLVCEALGSKETRNVLEKDEAFNDMWMDKLKKDLEKTLRHAKLQRGVLNEAEWGELEILRLQAIVLERPIVVVWSQCEKPITTTVFSPKL